MNKQALLYGVGGLLIGALFSGLIVASLKDDTAAKTTNTSDTSMTMQEMSGMLVGKTGDDFDQAFITGMVEHHQGAIDMANLAKQHAKHAEIKKMAEDIVSAQSTEIEMMQTWQTAWGYQTMPQSHNMH